MFWISVSQSLIYAKMQLLGFT